MQRINRRFVVLVVFALGFAVVASAEARQGRTVDPALKKAADARIAARASRDATAYGSYISTMRISQALTP